jgi:MFS family permease
VLGRYFDNEEEMNELSRYKIARRLLSAEIVLTSVLLSMPVMNLFFKEAGMNTTALAISQAVFTLVMLTLDIPAGWIADKFSRKWANFSGDMIIGLSLIYYSYVTTLSGVIVAEILFAAGLALSNGADRPLLRYYCQKLWPSVHDANDESGAALKRTDARNVSLSLVAQAIGALLGGAIGGHSASLTVRLSSVTFFIGALLSTRLIEPPRKTACSLTDRKGLVVRYKKSVSELKEVISSHVMGKNDVAPLVYANALGSNCTRALIWLLTPVAIAGGVPVWLVGFGWAGNLLTGVIGSHSAEKRAGHMSDRRVFVIGVTPAIVSCLVLAAGITHWSVWFYLGLGFARGWCSATLRTRLTLKAPFDYQTTVESICSTVSRLLYVPLILSIGYLADRNLAWPFLFNAIVIGLPSLLIVRKLSSSRQL